MKVYFLIVLEAGSQKSKYLQDCFSGILFLVYQLLPPYCILTLSALICMLSVS